ncbi:MAG: beta galactosidase jelly roll domain-containing protein [Puniceicoccales bacterium]|jgi:beta-galactosidase/beta-glucuronidase|nr:beta galactosidase jelly roll domain-containing protein [Puniceicoccales bacterium]
MTYVGFARPAPLLLAFAALVFTGGATDAGGAGVSLDGRGWHFALDPLRNSERLGWHLPPKNWNREKPAPQPGWDAVAAPHCWTVDARYGEFANVGWYRRSFVPPVPAAGETVWRLTLEAVGERCRVWVNGRDFGAHDSVGVPVVLDVTGVGIEPGKQNFLVVAADNFLDKTTIPGARSGDMPSDQLIPWLNYGGLLGSVTLESLPAAHITRQKLFAAPAATGAGAGAAVGSARLDVRIWCGAGGFGENAALEIEVRELSAGTGSGGGGSGSGNGGSGGVSCKGGNKVVAHATLPAPAAAAESVSATIEIPNAKPWTLASRQLYESRVTLRTGGVAGTGADGFRRWGLVDEFRRPRPLYNHITETLRKSDWPTPAAE